MAEQTTINILPVTLRGEIRRIIFETAEGSYTVLRLYADDGHEYTVVGPIISPSEGQNIEVTGNWEKSNYGMQLRVNSYRFTLPSTKDGVMRFLSSGAVPGIGKTLAKSIVEHFGDRTLSVLENNIDELLAIPKIGKKKLKAIAKAWQETAQKREIFIFLQSLGISPAYCI
ncbi:MAG: ATP-dependent RecD-like DNA helicase, partial [Lentisphaeria bacterium]|nr:ATP-dependent RecD-like DNA helicase [Lentisphaeria bacterium]